MEPSKNEEKGACCNVQSIVNFVKTKEPSQIKTFVGKELASRIMDRIASKRTEVGQNLFK